MNHDTFFCVIVLEPAFQIGEQQPPLEREHPQDRHRNITGKSGSQVSLSSNYHENPCTTRKVVQQSLRAL